MKKILLVLTLILLSTKINAQNITMAKAFYKKAQKEYENKNYKEVITLLEKTVEHLAGETNPDIIYLEAKSRYVNDININRTKTLFSQFLETADQNDERINEISGILVDIETSNNYYSNGVKKQTESILEDGRVLRQYKNENGIVVLSKILSSGKDSYVTRISTYSGNKNEPFPIKITYYSREGNILSVAYYENEFKRVRVYDNGKHIQHYDENRNLIQRYGYNNNEIYKFTVDGGFYSFESFKSWKNDDYVTYFKETSSSAISVEILETYKYNNIQPIAQHKDLNFGLVKKLRVKKNDFNGITFKYVVQEILFGKDGVPIKKEHFNKRGKLKNSFIYNKENKSWIKQ